MSDGRKRWEEDQDEYVRLCEKYGEPVQTYNDTRGNNHPRCNAAHHTALKDREEAEDNDRF